MSAHDVADAMADYAEAKGRSGGTGYHDAEPASEVDRMTQTLTKSPTWAEAVAQADHRIALGLTDVYLGDTWDGLDWSRCVGMDTGGTHRLDIATSVIFVFEDKGIRGRWFFDIEPSSANGKGHYEVDVPGIQRLVGLLPGKPRVQFQKYLRECAVAVAASADKYQAIATNEYGTAAALRSAADR